MRISAFELKEPVPALKDAIVIGTLTPWLDAGSVGTLVLSRLEEELQAVRIGEIAVPGRFFDFTRYRPLVRNVDGRRVLRIPNTTLSYVKGQNAPDILLFEVMEPHLFAEEYIESIVELVKALGVKSHCRLGAWYDAVPHTRTLQVSYSINGQQVDLKTGERLPRRVGGYEGPTSILNLFTDRLEEAGIENQSLMLRLPYYSKLEKDHTGIARMLETLLEVFEMPAALADVISTEAFEGKRQYRRLSSQVANSPEINSLVQELEKEYDSQAGPNSYADTMPTLAPDIEQFLREINQQLKEE